MKKFQDRYNRNPELKAADEADANSEYNQELGRRLEVTPEKAQRLRILVARKVKEKIRTLQQEVVQVGFASSRSVRDSRDLASVAFLATHFNV